MYNYNIKELTSTTLYVNGAIEGYASGKVVFLWKKVAPKSIPAPVREQMQMREPFTVLHYQRDREGLTRGLISLIRKKEDIKVWFPENEKQIGYLFEFKKGITLKELSKELDVLYI